LRLWQLRGVACFVAWSYATHVYDSRKHFSSFAQYHSKSLLQDCQGVFLFAK